MGKKKISTALMTSVLSVKNDKKSAMEISAALMPLKFLSKSEMEKTHQYRALLYADSILESPYPLSLSGFP